ncbi:MAG: hypothetical protein AB7O38_31590, partial [Pirellulaceae bacterium]
FLVALLIGAALLAAPQEIVLRPDLPADAPPVFTAVAWDDNERMTKTATALVDNWKKAKRPAELHVFADGSHGFGMNRKGKASDMWIDLLEQWMVRANLLPKR